MAYNNRANYTLSSSLNVHPVHVSRTDEEGRVTQDRYWVTVAQTGDPFCVHARVDKDVLQPKFQGLHYGVETLDEMRRCKRRRTAAMKKEETRAAKEESQRQDQLAQQRSGVEWEQARIDLWRQTLEERERAVAARESAVFQRKLEYGRLERCSLCGRRGRDDGTRGRRAGENNAARQKNEQRRRRDIMCRTTNRNASARAAVERRNDPEDRSRAGQLI